MRVTTMGCATLVAVGLAGGWGRAQPQTPQQNAPVFRGRVDLVTVDVTVVDKDGVPVPGLTADDFTVTVAGKPRPIRALDYLTFGPAARSAAGHADTTNQGGTATITRGGRAILLLFDDLSYQPGQGKDLLTSAQRLVSQLDFDDRVGLFTSSGIGPVVAPTPDRAALDAALKDKRIVGRFDDEVGGYLITMDEALDIDRGDSGSLDVLSRVVNRECYDRDAGTGLAAGGAAIGGVPLPETDACPSRIQTQVKALVANSSQRIGRQLLAYRAAIQALRVLPAPRVLVALTAGLAPTLDPVSQARMLDDISRAAAAAEVQFYAIADTSAQVDLTTACQPTTGSFTPICPGLRRTARQKESAFLMGGIENVVSAAGGELLRSVGQPDRLFNRILTETSGIYRLGVEAAGAPGSDGQFLNVAVSVRKPGAKALANRHALIPGATTRAPSTDDSLKARLSEGGAAFGVPIALATSLRRDPAKFGATDAFQAGVNVEVPGTAPGPLLAMYSLLGSDGHLVASGRQSVPAVANGEEYRFAFAMPIGPSRYQLRFAVADSNGNVGSVERTITGTLTHFDTVSVSDLFASWSGGDGVQHFLALERLPAAATVLHVSLELYPDHPASARDLGVRLDLIRSGSEDPFASSDITPELKSGVYVIGANVPVTDLEAGAYTIRAVVLVNGNPAGSVLRYLRKAE